MKPMPSTVHVVRNLKLDRPRGKPDTIVCIAMLGEHRNKMTPDDILPDP